MKLTEAEYKLINESDHRLVYTTWTWYSHKYEDGEITPDYESIDLDGADEEVGPWYCRTCDEAVSEDDLLAHASEEVSA